MPLPSPSLTQLRGQCLRWAPQVSSSPGAEMQEWGGTFRPRLPAAFLPQQGREGTQEAALGS